MERKGRFDPIADEYDDWSIIDPEYPRLHVRTVQFVQQELASVPESVCQVFEIGFGTGLTTQALLQCDPRVLVTGADTDSAMVAKAVERLREARLLDRVELVTADVRDFLRHDRRKFRVVASVCTVHNIAPDDRLAACQSAYDRLSPGGLFVSGDKIAPDDPVRYLELFDAQMWRMEGYKQRGMDFAYDFWRLHELEDHLRRITESQTVTMLERAGFEQVAILERFGIYALVVGRKPASQG